MVIRVPDQRNTPGGYAALDDRLLVLDFQAGNPQAFVEIHRRYGSLARHVCKRFLPQQQDVDEAFQETMIRVFQGLYRFNGRYALQPWIARIAKNVSLDILRGHARRPKTDDSAPASDELQVRGDEADEIVDRLVQRDTVLSVMADLPETHRRALMLREFEGRSHREVAQELEITTPQAKALIHRAKGSFRRLWLEKVSDRSGLMGFALLPLLWLAHAANVLRRVADRIGFAAQSAQAAAPEALTSTVTGTAAPAASGVTERLVAAGMTLLLAGGVTVGAAKIVSDRGKSETVARAEVSIPTTPDEPFGPPEKDDPRLELSAGEHGIKVEPPIVLPSPTVEPEPAVETPPEPEPSPSPTEEPPDPSPTPPPPPPAPEWDFSLRVLGTSATGCSCEARPELLSTTLDRSGGASLSFAQKIKGVAHAPDGTALWPYYLEHSGTVDHSEGSLSYSLVLGTDEGPFWYDGSASLAAVAPGRAGSFTYRFVGDYQLRPDEAEQDGERPAGLPTAGRVAASVSIWQDGTIYFGALTLLEA